ncbi:unnamed protein product [Closterium sp. NIES-53]
MASLRVLAFDHEGRPVQFDTWLDDLHLYLLSNIKDGVSLFDHVSGAATAPPTTADGATRSEWLSRDGAARLAIRNHLPLAECSHFGQHRTAQALYDAVVARYSTPATAALGRLLVPYLFPELSAFATVEDLVSHLRASDGRYSVALPAKFLAGNPPPMYITLYFVVTCLPDSLRSVRDHFLSLDPTSLTVDLLEQHLLAAETSADAVGAARGTPRPPFFEGCSPSPLAPSYASVAAADVSVVADFGAASASAKRCSGKGKGGKGARGGGGGGGGGSGSSGGGSSGGGGGGGTGGGSGGSGGGGGGSGGSVGGCGSRNGGDLRAEHRCFSRLDDTWRAEFGDDVELPRWADLLKSRIAIFDLDFDAILSAMYALSVSAEGDCYQCVPPDPGIAAAALGASESGTLPGTAPAQALHTFTLDSGTFACFFRNSTTLTPLSTPVPVRLADRSRGPVVVRSSTNLLCPAVPSGSLSGLHLPLFSANLVSTAALQDAMVTTTTPRGFSLYTLATEPPQIAASAQVLLCGTTAWVTPPCHTFMACTRVLVSGLPKSLPPLPPSPAPPCLPCVKGRQRAEPHSSSFPSTTAPLQTLHMDVWGPTRVSGQSREHYFLLVVDDYTRYTTVFPLRSKGQVIDVLIPWIRRVHLQLRERFGQDLPVLRLHSDRGGEFSSSLLRDFCHGEGILQSFTLPDSPQQNGIAEHRIGLVMEVARTSMIHAIAPHFLWPFAVRYAAHQLNLWPRVSLPETSPTLRWMGKVGDASVFRVWGSRAFVCDTSADKLFARAIPCVFLGFVPDAHGWQYCHPTSCRVFPSQDITFDESVPFFRLFPYRSAPPPPPSLFLAPGAASGGAEPWGAASGGAGPGGAESEGAETGGAEPGGVEPGCGEPGGTEPEDVEPGGAALEGGESGGAKPQGATLSGGSAGASPRLVLREWFVWRAHLRAGATAAGGARVAAGAGVPGGTAVTGPGSARTRGTGAARSGGVEGTGAGDPTESGATGAGGSGAGGAGAGGAGVGGSGTGGAGVGGPGVGGAGAGGVGAIDPGGAVRPRRYFVPLLQQSQPQIQPASPSPYTEQSGGLTERREPASRPVLPVCTARRVPRTRPPPDPGTHAMTLRPYSVPLRVPLPAPPNSSLLEVPDPESDRACAASPTISCLLATSVADPSFECAAASALVAELLDFATTCCLDYATALVAESASASPPSVRGECPPVPFPASSLASPLTHPGGISTTPPPVVFCPLRTSHPAEPVEVAVDSGAARGAEPAGAGIGGTEPEVSVSEGAEPGGAELECVEPGGAEPERVELGGAEPGGTESGGAEPERAESEGPPGVSSRREPLSPQHLREWYAWRCCGAAGAAGAGGAVGATGGAVGATGGAAGVGAAGGAAGAGAAGGASGAAGGAAGAGAARGAAGAGAAGGATGGTGAVGGPTSIGAAEGAGAAGPGGARTGGTGDVGAGGAAGVGAAGTRAVATGGASGAGAVGGTGAGGAAGFVAGDPGAEGTGAVSAVSRGAARLRPYYVPHLQQVLGLPPSPGPTPPLLSPPPVKSQSQLQPASPLPGPSPYSGPTRGLTERREPESRPVSPESRSASPVRTVRAGRRVSRPRPPPVPGTHSMTLRPSSAPQRVPLPSPPASSLPDGPDPESDSLLAASPTVTCFMANAVTDPLFDSTAASALVAELVDFAAACRLDYATCLVAESASASVCPPSFGGECALDMDVLEDRQEEFECFAAAVPHLVSMLLAPEGDPDAPDIPTPRSYAEAIEGTYVDEVPPLGANIVSGMWIFRVKRPPGSPPVFKARYVVRGFSQRQGVDFFQTFSPTPKMTTLRVLLHVAAQRDYELHPLDFSTAFLQGSLHEDIWLHRPPGFTGSFPAGSQWSLRRPVYGLRQAPREWHDTLRTTLAALDDLVFATADTEALAHVKSELQKRHAWTDLGELTSYLGLRITRDRAQRTIALTQSHMVQQVLQRFGFTYSSPQSTPLPSGHSLSAPPLDESVEPSGPYPELVGCLMYLMTCTRPDLAYPLSLLARYVAPGRHRKVHWDSAKRVLRYLCSMGSSCPHWSRRHFLG